MSNKLFERASDEYIDISPWLVRVKHNKVAVGVYFCPIDALFHLIDEIAPPYDCEAARLPFGGFHFSNNPILPDHYRYKDLSEEDLEKVWSEDVDIFYPTNCMSSSIDGDPCCGNQKLEWVDFKTIDAWVEALR